MLREIRYRLFRLRPVNLGLKLHPNIWTENWAGHSVEAMWDIVIKGRKKRCIVAPYQMPIHVLAISCLLGAELGTFHKCSFT